MQKWWACLLMAGMLVACAPAGDDDDDNATPTPDPADFPGACSLGQGYDGAQLPADFPVQPVGTNQVGETLEDFGNCIANSGGTEYHLYAYLGQVALVNFGAGWCPPCQGEATDIQALYDEFHDEGFIVLMGMFEDYNSNSPSPSFLDTWSNTYGLQFPVLADPNFTTAYYRPEDIGPNGEIGIPLNVIVDRDGVVLYNRPGALDVQAARNIIIEALAKEPTLAYPGAQ